jgi:integrase
MIRRGWKRKVVNKRIGELRRAWKWGVSHGLIPVATYQALLTVEGLAMGRTVAPESEEIVAIPRERIFVARDALRGKMHKALLEIHYLTGMRAGELVSMKGSEVQRGFEHGLWLYEPEKHKTMHHGHKRRIWLGPAAQEVLAPWLDRAGTGWVWPSRGRGRHKGVRCHIGEQSYCDAIQRACARAGIPEFTPLHVRHTALTEIRAALGLEAAQAAGGHKNMRVTEIYAEKNDDLARKVAAGRQ